MLVLVLDLWAPKRERDPLAIILFHHSDREIRRILEDEQEHEHDFSTSAFRLKVVLSSGRRIEVGPDFDSDTFERLVKILERL